MTPSAAATTVTGPNVTGQKPVQPLPAEPPPARPLSAQPLSVQPLSYTGDLTEPLGWVVLKLLVLVAALSALMGFLHSASALWVHVTPKPFPNVGTWPRGTWMWVAGPVALALGSVCNGLVLAGVAAFFRRWRGARLLLVLGAAGVIAASMAMLAMEQAQQSALRSAGYDIRSATVIALWRVQWVVGPLALPLLLILVMSRAEVKRWMAVRRTEPVVTHR